MKGRANVVFFSLLMLVPLALAAPTLTKLANPATLPPNTGLDVAWSPDNTGLVIASDLTPFVRSYCRSGSTFTAQANPANLPTGQANSVDWSRDGQYVAVAHLVSPFLTVYFVSGACPSLTLTKLANPATLPTGNGNGISWNNDGTLLCVAHAITPFISCYQKTGTGASATLTKIANPATLPGAELNDLEFNPAGSIVSAVASSASGPRLISYSVSGTTLTKITDPASLPSSAASGLGWDPTGAFLAVSTASTPFMKVYSVSGTTFTADFANPATLPTGAGRDMGWSPDSKYLTVSHATSPRISNYERVGTTLTKLANPADLPAGNAEDADWSPNGEFLAVAHFSSPFVTIYDAEPPASPIPDAPTNLTAVPGNGVINLTWTAAENAVSYTVCRSEISQPLAPDCSTYTEIGTSVDTDFSDAGVTFGVTYCYRVRSEADGGTSSEVCATPKRSYTPLFGDDGAIYGGSKAQTASNFNVGTDALGILWGVMLTLAVTLAGYGAFKNLGASIGGVVGVVISTAVGFFPLWLVAFVGVGFVSLYVYTKTRSDPGA